MVNKILGRAIDLAMDTMGMQGPVTRRAIAERVLATTTPEHWTYGELEEGKVSLLLRDIGSRMKEPYSEEFVAQYLSHVPPEFHAIFNGLPRFICISPNGGRGAPHVMSILATTDDWALNVTLKDCVIEHTQVSRDKADRIHDLLQTAGVRCLADLAQRHAAE